MKQEKQITMVKQLREKTGAGMMNCKRALEKYNWNENMAIKYLRHYPMATPTDFWLNRRYLYCQHCDRFYIVSKNVEVCNICGNKF